MAYEGPDYPPHPPLARPGWWRESRIWIAIAGVVVLLVLASVLTRGLARPGAQANGPFPTAAGGSQANNGGLNSAPAAAGAAGGLMGSATAPAGVAPAGQGQGGQGQGMGSTGANGAAGSGRFVISA